MTQDELDAAGLEAAIRALLPDGYTSAWGEEDRMWRAAKHKATSVLTAYLSTLNRSAPIAEPVAWWAYNPETHGQMVKHADLKSALVEDADRLYGRGKYEMRPLYTHPSPAEASRSEADDTGWKAAGLLLGQIDYLVGTGDVELDPEDMQIVDEIRRDQRAALHPGDKP